MIVIGVTGPTGAGKTTALRVLEELGVRVLDCDAIYHQMLKECRPMLDELRERFPDAFTGDALDRRRLGAQVWKDAGALADLNAITHKYIIARLKREIAGAQAAGLPGAAVDGVGLAESEAGALCDTLVAVTAPEEQRIRRIMAREGIDRDYALARVRAQHPSEWFSARCGHTLVNDGAEDAFRQRAGRLFRSLLGKS